MSKILFAFDFDKTITNVDVDDWLIEDASERPFEDSGFACLPDYMQIIFTTMHSRGCGRKEMLAKMDSIKISPPLMAACHSISNSANADAIIISNANTFCIKRVLKTNGLKETFKHIISNPVSFDNNGLFKIDHYHRHDCAKCPANLCKTKALAPYKVGYDRIVYIGDGSNDVCPSLSLSSNDVVVARKGFPLAKHVNDSGLLKATLHVVDFNEELVETVQEILL